jgi:hypothetical protein
MEGHNSNAICDNGRCGATCEDGFYDCRSSGGGNESRSGTPWSAPAPEPRGRGGADPLHELMCFDFQSDPCHCGGCGFNLPFWFSDFDAVTQASSRCVLDTQFAEAICCGGSFQEIGGRGFVDGACGSSCTDAAPCPSNAPSCCPTGANEFAHSCIDTSSDVRNCGGCSLMNSFFDCTTNPSTPPNAFVACCDSGCTDLNTDSNHCGGCGNNCNDLIPSPMGQVLCCPGAGPSPSPNPTGGCIDVGAGDNNNCGGCGRRCEDVCGPPGPSAPPATCNNQCGPGTCSCETFCF